MKKQLPTFLAGVAVTAMAFTCGPAIAAQIQTITASANTVNIALNGIQVAAKGESYTLANGTQVPYSLSYSGTTYLSIRKVGELVGQKIYWNGETGTAGVGVDPTKTPDATADYSTWTAEEEKAYQEFKGMWEFKPQTGRNIGHSFSYIEDTTDHLILFLESRSEGQVVAFANRLELESLIFVENRTRLEIFSYHKNGIGLWDGSIYDGEASCSYAGRKNEAIARIKEI